MRGPSPVPGNLALFMGPRPYDPSTTTRPVSSTLGSSPVVPSATVKYGSDVPTPHRSDRVCLRLKHLGIYDTQFAPLTNSDSEPQVSSPLDAAHSLSSFVSYDNFKPAYCSFLAAVTLIDELHSYREAFADPQ
ncbi:unnamed protein product [Linum trigynum]|uniref:Uncharacterized protein n=1 Tax=Linum trigynum TaxID=586398 RepID=A0AAV2CF47_9ROSI